MKWRLASGLRVQNSAQEIGECVLDVGRLRHQTSARCHKRYLPVDTRLPAPPCVAVYASSIVHQRQVSFSEIGPFSDQSDTSGPRPAGCGGQALRRASWTMWTWRGRPAASISRSPLSTISSARSARCWCAWSSSTRSGPAPGSPPIPAPSRRRHRRINQPPNDGGRQAADEPATVAACMIFYVK